MIFFALNITSYIFQMDIEFIVFLAIMLHKAPAAFGLVTFLLHEGLERQRIRKHLMIFALAAPIMALVTFLLLAMGGSGDSVDKVRMLFFFLETILKYNS
jgi:zinc transporter 9